MFSCTGTAAHNKAFSYPVMDHWGKSEGGQFQEEGGCELATCQFRFRVAIHCTTGGACPLTEFAKGQDFHIKFSLNLNWIMWFYARAITTPDFSFLFFKEITLYVPDFQRSVG